jgi:DNA gyrase/topoisomerase IV subunit A
MSTKNHYNLSEIASNEMREFALYTIENRAIPSMVDGLKPVQRFYLYSSIVNSSKEFKKVSAVSGIISEYGYNHGETSAAGAGQLMAATWNNNLCLVEGRGSFGTRQIQEAGAARYVYTRLHPNFHKYIKDLDLSPEHDDPEHSPPKYYLPIIPLVLCNGIKGIATGFATNILPRSPEDIIKVCKEYITKGRMKRLPISFPDFKGDVIHDEENRFIARGVFERTSKTQIKITEIPYGYDRESYVKILDKLEENGDIVSYDDQCSKSGFCFEVKLKLVVANKLTTEEKVRKLFKLEKAFNENLTVIGPDGDLKQYEDERDLIADFIEFKLGVLDERIDSMQTKLKEDIRWLNVKRQFIESVLEDSIKFKNQTKEKVSKAIKKETEALDKDIDRLLRINFLSLTRELTDELNETIKTYEKELSYWVDTTPRDQFIFDLDYKDRK